MPNESNEIGEFDKTPPPSPVTDERPTKVAIIDDEPLLRLGVTSILSALPGWRVVLEAGSVSEAFSGVERELPDVILLDLCMPTMDGIAAVRGLLERSPHSRVLVLTSYNNERDVLESIAAGAHGYALKAEPTQNLIQAIACVAQGQRYLSPLLARTVVTGLRVARRRTPGPTDVLWHLTPREREIFRMAVENHSNREIASALDISLKTVDSHRRRINDKLGCHSTAELVHFAATNGLLRKLRGAGRSPGEWQGAA